MDNTYYKFLDDNNMQITTRAIKCVAYMLDTNIWKVFAGEDAEYAIGGPTLELFAKSYNAKYPGSQLECEIKKDNSNTSSYKYSLKKSDGGSVTFNENDNLYFIKETNKAQAARMSSTGYIERDENGYYDSWGYTQTLGNSGHIGARYYYEGGAGLRPVVCLKSDVILKEDNGNYIIK